MKKVLVVFMMLVAIVSLAPSMYSVKPGHYFDDDGEGGGDGQSPASNWIVNSSQKTILVDQYGNSFTDPLNPIIYTYVDVYVRPVDGVHINIRNRNEANTLYIKIQDNGWRTFPNFYKVDGIANSWEYTGPGLWLLDDLEVFVLRYHDGYNTSTGLYQLDNYNKTTGLMDYTPYYDVYQSEYYTASIDIQNITIGNYWECYTTVDDEDETIMVSNGNIEYLDTEYFIFTMKYGVQNYYDWFVYDGSTHLFGEINSINNSSQLPKTDTHMLNRLLIVDKFPILS